MTEITDSEGKKDIDCVATEVEETMNDAEEYELRVDCLCNQIMDFLDNNLSVPLELEQELKSYGLVIKKNKIIKQESEASGG